MNELIFDVVVTVAVEHDPSIQKDELADAAMHSVRCSELSRYSRDGALHVREITKILQTERKS